MDFAGPEEVSVAEIRSWAKTQANSPLRGHPQSLLWREAGFCWANHRGSESQLRNSEEEVAEANSIQQAAPSPISNPRSLAVPAPTTFFWEEPAFPRDPHLRGIPGAGCPAGGIAGRLREAAALEASSVTGTVPKGTRVSIVLAVPFE
ncbi:hypothetical protein P7K49_011985 [Saguinus oedipus]|uniref:Uncharacterized protein n=1 Tax=Saguinus oedipus TaxID=9490 RepID=A0ABQ9VUL5_SAGOE|nr:hypothetical protein P7K49_011985 [Saguinus oedipus]